MTDNKILAFASLTETSAGRGTLLGITFHSPSGGDAEKITGALKRIAGETVLQLETRLTEGRVSQRNLALSSVGEAVVPLFETFRRADLRDAGGTATLMISKKGAVTLLKKGAIGQAEPVDVEGNDRKKNRLLDGTERFLIELGISDRNGRIHDRMQSKYRQIVRFSEYVIDAEKKLPHKGGLLVCDLCCGKSYLSFAAYHVLTELCGRDVSMICVDLKKSVMEYCAGVAEACGMTGMKFLAMNVANYEPPRSPDLVISLHACDTATDLVLDFASRTRASAILATPCCQHELNGKLDCPTLSFIAERPILRQKFCAVATDALRLLKLEAEGYRTDATELIDPEDTPKNVMLRAFLRPGFDPSSPEGSAARTRYEETRQFLYGAKP